MMDVNAFGLFGQTVTVTTFTGIVEREGHASGELGGRPVRVTAMGAYAVGTPFLIEKDGQRQCVHRLEGFEGWTVLGNGEPVRPIEDAEWNGTRWLHPIPLLKARKWAAMKKEALEREAAGCVTPHGTIDSDPESFARVMAAVELARIEGAAFSVVWTRQDNSGVTLDAAQMIEVGRALVLRQHQIHATARGLRADIAAATTRPQIAAIAWPA